VVASASPELTVCRAPCAWQEPCPCGWWWMVRAEEMPWWQVPWSGLGAAIPCGAWKIWGSALSRFAPCNFPESTVARLCCEAGWAVCRAGGRGPLGHTVMPAGQGPLQTAEEGCTALGLLAFPSSSAPSPKLMPWGGHSGAKVPQGLWWV